MKTLVIRRMHGLMISLTILSSISGLQLWGQTMQQETQNLVFPQMAAGGGWESELTIVAQGAVGSAGRIYFMGQNGAYMSLVVNGGQTVQMFDYNLQPNTSQTWKFTWDGNTRIGWILVANTSATLCGTINGVLNYKFKPGGVFKSQVGVLPARAVKNAYYAFDNTNDNKAAFALAMLGTAGNVKFDRYDENGVFQDTANQGFGSFNQQAMYLYQLFPNSTNRRGFVIISCDMPFNILALNDYRDNYSSTAALPTVFERTLTLSLPADNGTYNVHLTREGNFFYGVAVPSGSSGSAMTISGNYSTGTGGGKLIILNMQGLSSLTGTGANVTLMANIADERMLNANGFAILTWANGTTQSGTFTMITPGLILPGTTAALPAKPETLQGFYIGAGPDA